MAKKILLTILVTVAIAGFTSCEIFGGGTGVSARFCRGGDGNGGSSPIARLQVRDDGS